MLDIHVSVHAKSSVCALKESTYFQCFPAQTGCIKFEIVFE